jgi:hypothetical protein
MGFCKRDYALERERKKQVEELYKMNHVNQTYEFVSVETLDLRVEMQ